MNQDMMEALQALATDRGISVDALFGALFFYSAWRANQNTRGSHPSIP